MAENATSRQSAVGAAKEVKLWSKLQEDLKMIRE